MGDSKESMGSGTDMSRLSSFERALASSPFSEPSKQASVLTEFGDSDCGEPLESHHLRLNFRPTVDDDDFSQRKCCEFWKYITSRRDLQGLMVRPEVPRSRPDTDVDSVKPCTVQHRARPKTAVSMLQIVEEKGLIDRAFEVKMQQSRCSLGSHEYELGATADKTKCSCPGPCLKCPNMPTFNAQALCEELQTWDVVHPKSMEPPCHPPSVESLIDQSLEAKKPSRGRLGSHEYEMGAMLEKIEISCDDPNAAPPPAGCSVKCDQYCSNFTETRRLNWPALQCPPHACGCKEGYYYGQTLREAGYDKWSKGEPANITQSSVGQYCGAVHRPGTLNDVWCDLPTPFICEKNPNSLVDEE